jgi:hypothetical protein
LIRAGKDYFKNFGMLCAVLVRSTGLHSIISGHPDSPPKGIPIEGESLLREALPFIISAKEFGAYENG